MSEQEYQNCPYCDEEIKFGALKCKYCQSMLKVESAEESNTTAIPVPNDSTQSTVNTPGNYERKGPGLIVIAILLLVVGALGLLMSTMMFGDIGISAMIGASTAILSGIGFLIVNNKIR